MQPRRRTTELSPLFRSVLQADVLALLITSEVELTVNEIAGAIGRDRSQTAREVGKLINAGLHSARVAGRSHRSGEHGQSDIRCGREDRIAHLRPRHVIAAELQSIEGVVEAWIFGSWAARYYGEAGPPPADIDVLVVGRPDVDDVWDACSRAGRRLGREVNPRVIRLERWESQEDPFLAELRSRPIVRLEIEPTKDD